MGIVFTLFFLFLPAGVLYVAHHQRWAQKIGVILLCYLSGLLVGNLGLIPNEIAGLQGVVSEVAVALALPMLLFTLDIRQWSKTAGKAIVSMLFATTSVVTVATALFYCFRGEGVESTSHLAAMSVGMYTGGTPNIAAIKTALDIPHSQYIMFHSMDTLIGGAYILFMLTVGIPLFRSFLGKAATRDACGDIEAHSLDEDNYVPLFRSENLPQVLKIIALSLTTLAASIGLSMLAQKLFGLESTSALTIVLLTTIGMSLSFNQRVRALTFAYRTGMYLIYVFCFTVATLASLDDLATASISITLFVLGTIVGSLLLHAMLCKLAGIDGDTFIVTSVAAISSPPFVPLLAKALGNPAVLLSGMTTGIIGYALGNYLGISLALFLQR